MKLGYRFRIFAIHIVPAAGLSTLYSVLLYLSFYYRIIEDNLFSFWYLHLLIIYQKNGRDEIGNTLLRASELQFALLGMELSDILPIQVLNRSPKSGGEFLEIFRVGSSVAAVCFFFF